MIKKLNLVFVMIFLAVGNHVVKAQRNIGPPSLVMGAQACGTPSNGFDFVAELSAGVALDSANDFILQLSDPTGSFLNEYDIQELDRVRGPNEAAGGQQDLNFINVAVPTNANSDNYRVRVIASLHDIIGQISDPIPFHFFDDDNLLIRLNSNDDVIFCNVSSFAKEVSVEVTDLDGNVVDANSFKWEWFRDDVLIPGENNPNLLITEEGEYQAVVPVGLCINFFRFNKSNKIEAILANVSDITILTDASDFSYCPDEVKVLKASDPDNRYTYQWIKDGEDIENETASSIILPDNDFGGTYTLRIALSEDCTDLLTAPVDVTNEGSSITMPLPESLVFLPTQVITLVAETDAPIGSQFRWKRNTNTLISGPTTGSTLTFDVPINSVGVYSIEIDANDACSSMLSSQTSIFAAERFNISIAAEEVVDCDQDPITIGLAEMVGLTNPPDPQSVPLTEEQLALFDFEWFKDGVSTGETSLSFDVSSADDGGVFQLRATFRPGGLPGGDPVSNELSIDFLASNIELEVTPPVLEDGGSVVLTAPFNANYTYEWFVIQNGEDVLIDGESGNTLTVTEEGSYYAIIRSLFCSTRTLTAQIGGPAALSELIPNVITPNGDNTNDVWVLPNTFRESDVEVKIYTSMGKLEFEKSGGYNGEWPADSQTQGNELIYYYIIARNGTVQKKGTITVMR